MSQVLQDNLNYGIANAVSAFSDIPSHSDLDSDLYQSQDAYQESSTEKFSIGAVASTAFTSSPSVQNHCQRDSVNGLCQSKIRADSFDNSPSDSHQNQFDFYNCGNNSFTAEHSGIESSSIVPSLDYDLLYGEVNFNNEVHQDAIPHSDEEEFEIEIENSENERVQDVLEKSQGGFKSIVGQAVEGGVTTAATGILSAYINPIAATAIVNTGIAAGKKVCFGIANRRAQKKTTENPYSPTAVADSANSDSISEQSCTPSLEKSSEGKAAKWKEKGKEIGVEVGKEVAKQICFGIEKRRKQKTKGSTSVGKASKHFSGSSDPSLDYEPRGSEFGGKDFLSEIDVAEIVSAVSSCLCKKAPVH